MDLDRLKDKIKKVKGPSVPAAEGGTPSAATPDLIAVLKETDARQLTALRRGRKFFIIATGIFLVAFAVTFLDDGMGSASWAERVMQRGSLACIYCLVTALLFLSIRRLSRVDYSLPVREFLVQAEHRYRFMRPADWLLMVMGMLFVGIVSSMAFVPYLSRVFGFGQDYLPMSILFPVFILAVGAMGLHFTKNDWKRDRADLWLHIKQLQQDLEKE